MKKIMDKVTGDIYTHDSDNMLFIALGEVDHEAAEELRGF